MCRTREGLSSPCDRYLVKLLVLRLLDSGEAKQRGRDQAMVMTTYPGANAGVLG